MQLYLLRWNPAFSSFTEKAFDEIAAMLLDGDLPGYDWSICEPEGLGPGDWWILSRVGGEHNGIVGVGRFTSFPEKDESWRKNGKIISYADIEFWMLQRPEKTAIFCEEELQKVCPELDWDKGHSGVLIPPETAEQLAFYIAEKILARKGRYATSEFAVTQRDEKEFSLICGLLSGVCPQLLAELKRTQKPVSAASLARMPEPWDEIAYDEAAIKAGKSLRDSLKLLSWDNVPWTAIDEKI